MDKTPPQPLRNPLTHARHRREVLWQVTLPLALGSLAVLVVAGLVVALGAAGDASLWADISLVWLLAPLLLACLLPLALLGGLAYAVVQVIAVLPGYARQVQDFFVLVRLRLAQAEDRLVEPLLRLQSGRASADQLRRQVSQRVRRPK